jgi:hypothetical protein
VIAGVAARPSRARLKPRQSLRLIAGGGRPYALCRIFRQPHDLQSTRALFEAADITALLKRRDQTVNARFRAQIQRVLHFIEGWRHARLADALMDEHQELILLLGQHGIPNFAPSGRERTKPQQRESFYFSSCGRSTRTELFRPRGLH